GEVLVEVDRFERRVFPRVEPLPDALEGTEDVKEVDVVLTILQRRMLQVSGAGRASFILDLVLQPCRREVLAYGLENQQQGRQALLTVDQFPLPVVSTLHDDRLQEVLVTRALVNVIKEPDDLIAPPAIAALVARYEELAGDVSYQLRP